MPTFAITSDAEDLNNRQNDQEDGHPNSHIDIGSPVLDDDAGSDEFKGQYSKPGESVVPAHRKTPEVRQRVILEAAFRGPGITMKDQRIERRMCRRHR